MSGILLSSDRSKRVSQNASAVAEPAKTIRLPGSATVHKSIRFGRDLLALLCSLLAVFVA
jgi:hypothetical protein